ncbi:MAG TPA: HAD family hydrolase [Tepidisphaeraceae bacterium]|nr:HAD family hydrolase [Tepidisphaeraceae bacterium]
MSYSAVLFDLDGTLLDTLDDLADACNAALTIHHFPTHPVNAYRHFVGEGVPQLIAKVVPLDRRNESTMAAVAATYRVEYQKRWNNKSKPYAGIPDMLDELTRKKIRLAVLSNKPNDFTHQCVQAFLPRWKFDVIRGAMPGIPRKPHPEPALKIAKEMNLQPADVIYLGDTNTDMQTAVAARMYPVGVLWGFRDRAELESAGAKALIKHPTDLLKLIPTVAL